MMDKAPSDIAAALEKRITTEDMAIYLPFMSKQMLFVKTTFVEKLFSIKLQTNRSVVGISTKLLPAGHFEHIISCQALEYLLDETKGPITHLQKK